MALGPTFYFKEYKNFTISQLKRHLRNLLTSQQINFLQRLREKELNDNIDDTNAWTDHHTSIEVIVMLIEYKTLYPKSDLSNWDDYWAIQRAVTENAGAVETQKLISSNKTILNAGDYVADEAILPQMPPPPLCPDNNN